jgi:hypothetical protein
MQDVRAKNLISNPRWISRRHMLRLGATAMGAVALSQKLGIISVANALDFSDEEISGIVQHCVLRGMHCEGAGPDPDATQAARDWAASSPQGTGPTGEIIFAHDPNRAPYGENLAWGPTLTAAEAVALWYDENVLYDYSKPGFSQQTGHFTQLVWRASTAIGMGMARRGGMNLWVARYFPAGNITGQFQLNVFPPFSCVLPFSKKPAGVVPPPPEPLPAPKSLK